MSEDVNALLGDLVAVLARLFADDPEDGPLGDVRADEPDDLRWPEPFGDRPADGVAEIFPGALDGRFGPAVRPPAADQLMSHVSHAVMMPRPDG